MQAEIPYNEFDTSCGVKQKVEVILSAIDERLTSMDFCSVTKPAEEFGNVPMARYTLGLCRFGIPEFINMGYSNESDAMNMVGAVSGLIKADLDEATRFLMPADELAEWLNRRWATFHWQPFHFRAVNPEQFMMGYGLNAGRWYAKNEQYNPRFIQIVSQIDNLFPWEPNYNDQGVQQVMLPTQPFGVKEDIFGDPLDESLGS